MLLRTLFIAILGLGPDGLAARRRANRRLADFIVAVVNGPSTRPPRSRPLAEPQAMAIVGAINELILQTKRRRPVTSVVVSHDMKTVLKVADRVVMFFPLTRLRPDEPQVLFDGTPEQLREATDPRVKQFIEGEARDRLAELQE